jgi:drug/metabolite transporter (DMT)-like permease
MDWVHLLVLSLLCTTLAYILTLRALQHLSAFASNLTINLEPVYGIILAILLLGEHKELTISFYVGVMMILMAVISYPYLKKKIAV